MLMRPPSRHEDTQRKGKRERIREIAAVSSKQSRCEDEDDQKTRIGVLTARTTGK